MADNETARQDQAAAREPPAAAHGRFDTVIDAWFIEAMNGSIVSRHTDIFNHVAAAVQDLKQRLAREI